MSGGDLHIAREPPQPPGGGVPVHPCTAGVEQDRAPRPAAGGAVDRAADRWRQRDQDDLAAFAAHAQHPVTVLLAEIGDIRAGGLEDPQAEQAEHGDQGEVIPIRRLTGRGEEALELQVREPQRRRLRRHRRAADVLGGRVRQRGVVRTPGRSS